MVSANVKDTTFFIFAGWMVSASLFCLFASLIAAISNDLALPCFCIFSIIHLREHRTERDTGAFEKIIRRGHWPKMLHVRVIRWVTIEVSTKAALEIFLFTFDAFQEKRPQSLHQAEVAF